MHLIYENVLMVLIMLWTGTFKGLDQGTGSYELNPTVWEGIGAATAACGDYIPSAFGQRPPNVATDAGKKATTADSWSFWLLYLGPILLYNRFTRRVYYDHFVEFVKLIKLCLEFEIKYSQIDVLRQGFKDWVLKFEELYYQHDPDRVSVCPLTIHALLHIADTIEWCGPVWTYWAFPTERYCNRIQPAIKSRRYPFACIDEYVTDYAVLSSIKANYNLSETLRMHGEPRSRTQFSHPSYPTCVLIAPTLPSSSVTQSLHDKIVISFATRFDTTVANVRRHYQPDSVEQWSKVRRLGGGDDMKASSMDNTAEDRRDATFIRYDMLVDINARHRNRQPKLKRRAFYGSLQNIFVVHFPAVREFDHEEQTYVLAGIHTCEGLKKDNGMKMPYYDKMGRYEVVDISCVQCLVGRVKVSDNSWAIVDRTGEIQRAYYLGDIDDVL
ncbi:hypothetical protein K435DRAFT_824523 [Dendrothele bispora CBS 962.96]|uniref:DUF4218 domain-containing protein n=1 Tax=Dendrothele bispora (strain CBS 962.96) TaxID=1314807 RepID=A0A4S8KMD7_DENBC|nr:hypothetical protein K435DRAFT_824523 [Dendrothele bispora CBS 962.96]